jgi:hypothetical protein
MKQANQPSGGVLIRDLLIFQLKLWMDGLKDIVLSPVSIVAAVMDLLLGPGKNGPRLYGVLRLGERFDLWLNLFGAAGKARHSPDGLFAGSEPGDRTLLGTLEGLSGAEAKPGAAPPAT